MKKAKVIRGLKNLLNNRNSSMDCLGIRFDDDDHVKELFEDLAPSLDLYEGSDTYGKELEGTCAIYIDFLGYGDTEETVIEKIEEAINSNIYDYSYEHIYVIGGSDAYDGMDPHETVIANAVVLAEVEITEK